jgi:hypothetical protein
VNARKVRSAGTLSIGGGIALASAILLRQELVSPWWLLWADYMVIIGALVRRRYRWSPELMASIFIIGVSYALFLLATWGSRGVVWFIALGLLAVYPQLRRSIRPPSLGESPPQVASTRSRETR